MADSWHDSFEGSRRAAGAALRLLAGLAALGGATRAAARPAPAPEWLNEPYPIETPEGSTVDAVAGATAPTWRSP